MYEYEKQERFIIHSYKHNGNIHRAWDEAVLLDDCGEYLVFGNDRTKVFESDGRSWRTKEPAIMFFYKNKWYNVIGQLKQDGIYYYCNMASPFLLEDGAIKYIDYDLDLRVFPDGGYKILDNNEYNFHKKIMNYPSEIDVIVKKELDTLIEMKKNNIEPFDKNKIEEYHKKYNELKNYGII